MLRKLILSSILLLISFFTTLPSQGVETEQVNKKIVMYFIDWDILSRSRLSSSDIRRMRHVYVELKEETSLINILKSLKKLDCDSKKSTSDLDVRLVIDVLENEKVVKTYNLNKKYVSSGGSYLCKNSKKLMEALNIFMI